MEDKRTLNQMPGFKKGFEALTYLQPELGEIGVASEEYLAFALGALARVYGSVNDPEKLWELRNKLWKVEEKLGELQKNRIDSSAD
ncbi:hypothetical protein [Pseudobacteriovorax antillogorgiicola]|uniref:Uncharacterized protein n=1 Tax=Pseudobacteriovorax antillogorgiicola TaxID=1513793 RepID=A0A1Y6C3H4_9BACT|nr:hypothetical protein [Pseudobacteriovorax antillogorgiicola]TCS43363.1 hypothetical protein EDD56_1373 [Pseudobacteriovorax antillogorgiicola]SMF35140.1 hypothetical protein SAMN06296036_110205 [Pseudobacteriovorax antillogorgiicola]